MEQRKREIDQERKIAQSNKSSRTISPIISKCENEPIRHQKLDPKMRTELSKAEKERLLEEKMKVFSISNKDTYPKYLIIT